MKKNGRLNLGLAILYIGIMFFLISCYGKDETTDIPDEDSYKENQNETIAPEVSEDVDEILNNMSIAEKVGQMFFCAKCSDKEETLSAVTQYHAGGIIMFADDFEYDDNISAQAIKNDVINKIQNYKNSAKIPLLVGVDEEGGTTVRISKYLYFRNERFKSPRELYNNGGITDILQECNEKCTLLESLGINMNIGPVCDIVTDKNQFMYERSLGENADITASYVEKVVECMNDANIISVLKHFPGNTDNAKPNNSGCVIDTTSYEEFSDKYFKPFKKGIDAGAECILVGHNIVSCMDEDTPASISYDVHKKYIEGELNFNGVIITDNLDMSEIQIYCNDNQELAIKAVQAGNDMIISTEYETQMKAIIDAVARGEISMDRIDFSVKKILNWKKNMGLL